MSNSRTWHGSNHLPSPPPAAPTSPPDITRRMPVSSQMSLFFFSKCCRSCIKRTNKIRYGDVCNRRAHRGWRKVSHSTQTVTKPDSQQVSLSLQSISGSSTGPSQQRCTAGGEAHKHSCFFVVQALTPTPPPSSTVDSLWPSHLHLGGLFFLSAELTSLFNFIDSCLHFGCREGGSAPECLPMLWCLQRLVLGALKDA